MNNILNGNITIYHHDLRLSRDINKPHVYKPNTTLNEILGINKENSLTSVYPTLSYFAIGVGGDTNITTDGSFSISKHSAKDATLFDIIPFVLRLPTNDITVDERKKYCFSKDMVVNGVTYKAYYLKTISDIVSRDDFFKIVTNESGKSSLAIYNTNDESIIFPKPIDKAEYLIHPEKATLIAKTNKFLFNLDASDLAELDNVMTLLGITKSITEIALCNAITPVTIDLEPKKVQVAYFATCNLDISLKILKQHPVNIYFEVGSNEPYL